MRRRKPRILFSSDLHALKPAFALFAKTLAEGPFGAAVIAGDLLDYFWLPDRYLMEKLGVEEDELLDELRGEDEFEAEGGPVSRRDELNRRGLLFMEAELKAILATAGKPVFIVPGNHDTTPWADEANLVNLDGRRVEWEGLNLVGFRWTSFELGEEEMAARVAEIETLVDERTVLVSHDPPHGILDRGWSGPPLGNEELGRLVREKKPLWHLFGHVHSRFGAEGRSVNGAYPDSRAFFDLDLAGGRCRVLPADVAIEPRVPI